MHCLLFAISCLVKGQHEFGRNLKLVEENYPFEFIQFKKRMVDLSINGYRSKWEVVRKVEWEESVWS